MTPSDTLAAIAKTARNRIAFSEEARTKGLTKAILAGYEGYALMNGGSGAFVPHCGCHAKYFHAGTTTSLTLREISEPVILEDRQELRFKSGGKVNVIGFRLLISSGFSSTVKATVEEHGSHV